MTAHASPVFYMQLASRMRVPTLERARDLDNLLLEVAGALDVRLKAHAAAASTVRALLHSELSTRRQGPPTVAEMRPL